MKAKILVLIFITLTLFGSWNIVMKNSLGKAGWLLGTWENKTKKGSMYENWTKASDVKFIGKSYALKANDTVTFENIELIEKQNSLFYVPTVKNQNNNLPVSFSLQMMSDNQFIFENRKHDFPQFISYKKITPDSMVAEIYGTINGQKRKEAFPMRRAR